MSRVLSIERRPRLAGVRTVLTVAAIVAVVGIVASACGGTDIADEEPAPTTQAPTTTTAAPTITTIPEPTTTTTRPEDLVLRSGSTGAEVESLEGQLQHLGYRPGDLDGVYDASTASAVMAFQKHEGLGRDGAAGPETRGKIFAGATGAGPQVVGSGPRLEVDIARQIMFVTLADGTTAIINVSTGNNETYDHPNGGTARAVTPVGSFAVERKIDAAEKAPLGVLYRPMYFKGGFAVHGSGSVPGYPASHGCVRVSNADEDWLFPQIPTGTPVVLYGGEVADAGTDNPAA